MVPRPRARAESVEKRERHTVPEGIHDGIPHLGLIRVSPGQQYRRVDEHRFAPERGQLAALDLHPLDPLGVGGFGPGGDHVIDGDANRATSSDANRLDIAVEVSGSDLEWLLTAIVQVDPDSVPIRPADFLVHVDHRLDEVVAGCQLGERARKPERCPVDHRRPVRGKLFQVDGKHRRP